MRRTVAVTFTFYFRFLLANVREGEQTGQLDFPPIFYSFINHVHTVFNIKKYVKNNLG